MQYNTNPKSNLLSNDASRGASRGVRDLIPLCTFPTKNVHLQSTIGEGSYGKVYLGKGVWDSFSTSNVAIKVIPKRNLIKKRQRRIYSEIESLASLQVHPNIVRLVDWFEDDENISIVTEWCPGGDLTILLHRFADEYVPEIVLKRIFKQVIYALYHCRSKGIVHGDVKPENICLKNDDIQNLEIKIIDFGSSQTIDEILQARIMGVKHRRGTPLYMSPEVISSRGLQTPLSDIWSLGIMMYYMATKTHPYRDGVIMSDFQKMKGEKVDNYRMKSLVSSGVYRTDLFDLTTRCLIDDVEERITLDDAMIHPCFNNV